MIKYGLLLCSILGVLTAFDSSRNSGWEAFKEEYNKVYTNRAVEFQRRKIWENNVDFIERHNKEAALGYHTFTVGENEYADFSPEEWQQMMGLSYNRTGDVGAAAPVDISTDDLPDSVDWSQKGYVAPVKNQGQCGSCWAFSAVGAIESAFFKKTGKRVTLSEQNIVDCDNTSSGCNGGWMKHAFRWVVQHGGINTEASYPYHASDGSCQYKPENSGATLTCFVEVEYGSEAALQRAIALGGPASVGIDASHQSFGLYKDGVYRERKCSTTNLGHAVLAYGYGKESDGEVDHHWLLKNSWGTSWGNQGRMKMARNQNNMCGISSLASYPIA